MQNPETWNLISKHLSKSETQEDKALFLLWLAENETNKEYFYKVERLWFNSETLNDAVLKQHAHSSFREKFTLPRIKDFIVEQALGNLIGFIVGIWVTGAFTHQVLEKRSLKNFFGLAGRKHIVVNEIPQWGQNVIAVLIGFIVLELISHFFKNKLYLSIWTYIQRTIQS